MEWSSSVRPLPLAARTPDDLHGVAQTLGTRTPCILICMGHAYTISSCRHRLRLPLMPCRKDLPRMAGLSPCMVPCAVLAFAALLLQLCDGGAEAVFWTSYGFAVIAYSWAAGRRFSVHSRLRGVRTARGMRCRTLARARRAQLSSRRGCAAVAGGVGGARASPSALGDGLGALTDVWTSRSGVCPALNSQDIKDGVEYIQLYSILYRPKMARRAGCARRFSVVIYTEAWAKPWRMDG